VGEQRPLSPEALADKSAVPEWRPHPTLPREVPAKSGRGSERPTLVA
jgi:hypothetical protein